MKEKITKHFCHSGMIAGVVGGCACGMISWLVYASTMEGGLAPEHFVTNTGKVMYTT